MELIRHEITAAPRKPRVALHPDRLTLAKRRWRGVAEDGREFGFDLERPLRDGAIVFETESAVYSISQQAEEVFEIAVHDPMQAARVGWMVGNLHFPIAIENGVVLAPADPAVRQLLEREHIHYAAARKVFHPLNAAAAAHHHHHHEH
jgi:urease accessory protein